MRSYHPDVKFNIVNSVHSIVTANLLGRLIVSTQQGLAGQTRSDSRKVPCQWSTQRFITSHTADSSPALERTSSTSSIYTALERAISSFSLCLMLVNYNGLRVTEASSHSPSTASFPEASLRCRIGYSTMSRYY